MWLFNGQMFAGAVCGALAFCGWCLGSERYLALAVAAGVWASCAWGIYKVEQQQENCRKASLRDYPRTPNDLP